MSILGSLLDREANAPIPFSSRPSGVTWWGGSRSDRTGQMEVMERSGTLFSIVNQLSEAIAQTKFGLFMSDDENPFTEQPQNQREFKAPSAHPAAYVWMHPNPAQTQFEFLAMSQAYYELTGEAWWVVGRAPGFDMPLELWPVRPDRIEVVPHPTKFIAGYVYHADNGEKIPLQKRDVISQLKANPLDPYRGMGPVQTILPELDGAKSASEWSRSYFRNSAQPGGVIQSDDRLSDAEFDRLVKQWNDKHKGVSNAGRVAVLEGATWKSTQLSMVDMQFVDLRKLNSDMIRQAFAFPKAKLGEVEDVNRANGEAQEVGYARNLIRPRLARLLDTLNNKFLPMFGEYGKGVEFWCPDPVTEDQESQATVLETRTKAVQALVEAGYDPHEALAIVGLNDMAYVGRAGKVGGEAVWITETGPDPVPTTTVNA